MPLVHREYLKTDEATTGIQVNQRGRLVHKPRRSIEARFGGKVRGGRYAFSGSDATYFGLYAAVWAATATIDVDRFLQKMCLYMLREMEAISRQGVV
jgi:hypothetical protein